MIRGPSDSTGLNRSGGAPPPGILLKHDAAYKPDELSVFVERLTFAANNFGHHDRNPAASCGDRIIGDFEILYFLGGSGCVTVGGRRFDCGLGDLVLIPPFVKHRIETSQSDPYENFWIHFDVHPVYRHAEFSRAMLPGDAYGVRIGYRDELVAGFKFLEAELRNRHPGYHVFLNTLLVQTITLCLRAVHDSDFRAAASENGKKYRAETSVIDGTLAYINENIDKPIVIGALCARLHVSESYLYKCFSNVLRLSPNRFIAMVRMKRAEQLIRTSPMSLKEISEALGFCTPYYFSGVFKRFFGVPPRDYRNDFP